MTEPAKPPAPDIGSVLRQARLRRGQSLEAVFQHTRIPKKFLEALESNRLDEFPAAVYLRGFMKGYCDHLDVEFEPLWGQVAPKPPETSKTEAPAPDTQPQTPGAGQPGTPEAADSDPNATLILLALAAVLLPAGAVWLARRPRHVPAPPPTPPAAAHLPAPIAPLKTAERMSLRIVFRREAWVRLHCDGRLRFEGRGPAGFAQEWQAADDFILRASNPDDLGLILDGKEHRIDPAQKDADGNYKIVRP